MVPGVLEPLLQGQVGPAKIKRKGSIPPTQRRKWRILALPPLCCLEADQYALKTPLSIRRTGTFSILSGTLAFIADVSLST